MQNHFTFGHTIQPIQIESGSSSLEDLFKIGDEYIQIPHKEPEQLSDSDETPKQKKQKKAKKEGRQKRKRSRSRKDRAKGKGGEGGVIDLQSSGSAVVALPSKRRDGGAMELLQRSLKSRDEDLSSNFSVNKKVGEGLLNIDILSFPQKELYAYGPMDKDIPQYGKYPNFDRIIGCPLKKQKAIDQCIRHKINQKSSNPHKDDISRHRYFHFSGYAGLTVQPLPHYRPLSEERSFIPLGQTETFSQSAEEEKRLKTVREFNSRLNSNPKNVDLWLQFAESQETHSGKSQSKGKAVVLERQLSILQKALQCNPLDHKLGLFYLDLLFRRQNQPVLVMSKCMQLIKAHPDCGLLWKSYLFLQLCQFSRYSHELTREVFQELTRILRSIMDGTRSAMQVWRIRKSGLELIRNMVMVYRLSGYGELATGIIVGLVDFNFFMPDNVVKMTNHKDKVSAFGEYWENHSSYKLGEVQLQGGWENQDQIVPPETVQFIGHLHQPPLDLSDLLTKELTMHRSTWRPSHPIHDRETISQHPQSYILIEDIQFTLHLYRDTDSLTSLLDILADHLQFPHIFIPAGFNSQFGCSLVRGSFRGRQQGSSLLGEQTYWWRRYWNPFKSSMVLSPASMQKLQYFKRILCQARSKLPEKHNLPLTRYLVFIGCCYYASQDIQERVKISEEESLKDLEQLLRDANSDMGCWSIYISTTHRIKGNTLECIECYLQLLQANHQAPGEDRREKQMEIVFYLWTFVGRHHNQALRSVLKLYLRLLDEAEMASFTLGQELTASDEHRLTRYLKEKLSVILDGKLKNKIETIHLLFIVLDCLTLGYLEELLQLQKHIKQYLIDEMVEGNDPSTQHFILNSLIDRRTLTPETIAQRNLLTVTPYLELVQYWVRQNTKPLVIFLSDFESLRHKSLSLWMVTYQYLSRGAPSHLGIQDHLFGLGRQLCFEDSLHEQHPDYVILLSEMLLRDVGQSQSEFLRYALNQLPFAKELYLFNLMSSPQKEEREKLVALMQEKSIRILQPSMM